MGQTVKGAPTPYWTFLVDYVRACPWNSVLRAKHQNKCRRCSHGNILGLCLPCLVNVFSSSLTIRSHVDTEALSHIFVHAVQNWWTAEQCSSLHCWSCIDRISEKQDYHAIMRKLIQYTNESNITPFVKQGNFDSSDSILGEDAFLQTEETS